MVESNKPLNRTDNSQVWGGIAIGAGAGAGIAGMTMGGAYLKHQNNIRQRDAAQYQHRQGIAYNALKTGAGAGEYMEGQGIHDYRAYGDPEFRMHQRNTAHSRMGGGWKRAAIGAGLTGIGAAVGGVVSSN